MSTLELLSGSRADPMRAGKKIKLLEKCRQEKLADASNSTGMGKVDRSTKDI